MTTVPMIPDAKFQMERLELVSFQDPIFNTIQGEGIYTGTPSTFIRLQGCNQECNFCDTKDSWVAGLGRMWTTWEIIKKLEEIECLPHVVITGGNPMLQAATLSLLLSHALFRGKTITIETNAYAIDKESGGSYLQLAMPHHEGFLWSLSPKLHQWNLAVLRGYLASRGKHRKELFQLKVVVESVLGIEALGELVKMLLVPDASGPLMSFQLIVQPEYSRMRKLTRDPDFLKAVLKLPVPAKVLGQAHKSMSLM